VHTCRKWRRVVFASQQALHLRLFCTHGTPVQKTLDCWPATLPIAVEYGGSPELNPPAPEDEDNIITALMESDRVRSISLTVTSRLLGKSYAISKPLSELEDLALLSQEYSPLTRTLTSAFQFGTRLRRLHLTWITLPPFLPLLHSSRNLVYLQLHEVILPWRFPWQEFVNALSGMTQLQSLSLHPLPTKSVFPPPPSRGPVDLPVLARFRFQGSTGGLDPFVASINAPCLGHIDVTLLHRTISELSNLTQFINRIKLHKSYRRADILSSEHTISISLTQPGAPTYLKIELLCEPLALQLSSMAQICTQLSPLLFDVEDLRITGGAIRLIRLEDIHRIVAGNFFTGVKWLHVRGFLAIDVLRALQLLDTGGETLGETVLPALQKVYIPEPRPGYTPFRAAIVSFIISCRVTGHDIAVECERQGHEIELSGGLGQGTMQYHQSSLLAN
jgi:hypothetical protein